MAGIQKSVVNYNPIKYNLHHGLPSVGTWLTLCSPEAAENLAQIGWDWLLVDVEHSPVGFETMVHCFRATQMGGAAPMARVPWRDTVWIQRTLDAGALGLVVPMVNTAADAEWVVANTKYGPRGIRSFAPGRLTGHVGGDYRQWADDNIAVVVMIETVEAVKNAEQILSVPGVDGGFIGPSDLSMSMGIRSDEIGPGTEHEAMMQSVLAAGKKVGTAVGLKVNVGDPSVRIEQGFQFIGVASDLSFLVREATAQFQRIRQPKRDGK